MAGGTSASYSFTTLTNVTADGSHHLVLNNIGVDSAILSEGSAGATFGASQVNVASATTLAQALDLAAATAAASQTGLGATQASGYIAGHTGVADWFQFGGNTYIVEANNTSVATAATNATLDANDMVIKIVGLVDLSGAALAAHAITI